VRHSGRALHRRSGWLGALQPLDLGLPIHADHDRVGRWVQVQPDHVAHSRIQLPVGGELEGLDLPGLEVVLGSHPGHRAMADAQLASQQPREPVVTPSAWGGGARVAARISARRLRRTLWGPRRGRSLSLPPGDRRRPREAEPLAISVLATPSAASSRILARWSCTSGYDRADLLLLPPSRCRYEGVTFLREHGSDARAVGTDRPRRLALGRGRSGRSMSRLCQTVDHLKASSSRTTTSVSRCGEELD
jgi:hypothetical protein